MPVSGHSRVQSYYADDAVTIYHGDARELLPAILGPEPAIHWAPVFITDPPYGINHASNMIGVFQGEAIAGDEDTTLRDWLLATYPYPAAVFGSWKQPRPAATRAVLTWDKGEGSGMGDLAMPWRPNTEEIYILGRGWTGRRGSSVIRDTSVVTWTGNGRGPRRLHPNEKPLGLLRGIIAKAPPGMIFDPFAGSGTTLRAAKDLNRRAIGIELDERYCEIAARRCAQEVFDYGEATNAG